MKIDLADYLTPQQAADELGCNRRALYRAKKRAEAEGHVVTTTLLGKSVFPRKALAVLRNYYYPYYSEAHQRMVSEWGRRGGTQKRINSETRESSSRSGKTGRSVGGRTKA